MADFYGYKKELDALRLLMEGFHYYDDEVEYFAKMLLHKFKDVLYYYDPEKPKYKIDLKELVLNYNYTLTFCTELLDHTTKLGRCFYHMHGDLPKKYLKIFADIKVKLAKNIAKLTT